MKVQPPYQEIFPLVVAEFKSLKRYDEVLCLDTPKWLNEIIQSARTLYAHTYAPQGTDHLFNSQWKPFLKHLRQQFSHICGLYQPEVDNDIAAEMAMEKYQNRGLSIVTAMTIDTVMRSDKIYYFADMVASNIYRQSKRYGFSDTFFVPYTRRAVRLVIGHERRHKVQHWLKRKVGTVCLRVKKRDRYVPSALEYDAEYWSWESYIRWFSDQTMSL